MMPSRPMRWGIFGCRRAASPVPHRRRSNSSIAIRTAATRYLRFSARCAARAPRLVLHYDLFFDLDAQHRGLWRAEHEGQTQIGIFASDHREHTLALDAPSRLAEFLDYGREGVWHIWIGYDHILFLLSLLLPAVLWRSGGHWVPVPGFRPALTEVVKVVTAFTLAHSVTLSLAVLKVIALPARLVESAIAASVLLAALNNLYPLVTSRRWLVAFGFGLVHGLGFASVLLDLGLPTGFSGLGARGLQPGGGVRPTRDRHGLPPAGLRRAPYDVVCAHGVSGRLARNHVRGGPVAGAAESGPQAPLADTKPETVGIRTLAASQSMDCNIACSVLGEGTGRSDDFASSRRSPGRAARPARSREVRAEPGAPRPQSPGAGNTGRVQ